MFDTTEFLIIGQSLSVLTYIFGVLVYALPLPMIGLKKWAPRLVSDGIYALVLVTAYNIIVTTANQLQIQLTGSWPSYLEWINNNIATLTAIYQYVLFFVGVLSVIPYVGSVTQALFPTWTVTTILSGALSFLSTLELISLLIYNDFTVLVAMGIMLFALPFRLGRAIGASLLASSIIFYIGLPYMPTFLINIGLSPLSPNEIYLPLNQHVTNTTIVNTFQLVYQYIVPSVLGYLVFGPMIYLGILSGLSIGLANTIAGYGGRLPFPLDVI